MRYVKSMVMALGLGLAGWVGGGGTAIGPGMEPNGAITPGIGVDIEPSGLEVPTFGPGMDPEG